MCKMWKWEPRQNEYRNRNQETEYRANREPTTDNQLTTQQMLNILQNVKHKESKQSETTKQKSP